MGTTRTPRTTAASGAFAAGSISSATPRRRSPAAIGRTPRVGSTAPSSDSSPTMARPGPSSRGIAPAAARMATAIGRSKAAPALRRSAGARFTVMRCGGKSKPELRMAARTRSRLSRTLASGSPTMAKTGRPKATSASTDTGSASTPTRVALCTWASTPAAIQTRCRADWRGIQRARLQGRDLRRGRDVRGGDAAARLLRARAGATASRRRASGC